MVSDHRRLAEDVAVFKANPAQTLGPSFNCRSHEDQNGQTTYVACGSGSSTRISPATNALGLGSGSWQFSH
jgi:hypothetical protein